MTDAPTRRAEIINPFPLPGLWLKGCLHIHTTGSDGQLDPEETVRRYHGLGYDFASITDHNVVIEPRDLPEGFLHIPGVEYDTEADNPERYWHVVSVGTEKCLAMPSYPVNAMLRLVAEVSPFYFVAHPYWSNLGGTDLTGLPAFPAVEIYNHLCQLWLERGHAEFHWDHLLSAGRRMWGLATDDAHKLEQIGGGRVVVRAAERSVKAIITALSSGHFYSTTGPEFLDLRVEENRVWVRTSPVRSIAFIANTSAGKYCEAAPGQSLTEASYDFRGSEIYLRVQCTDAQGRRAWTNPIVFWTVEEKPTP